MYFCTLETNRQNPSMLSASTSLRWLHSRLGYVLFNHILDLNFLVLVSLVLVKLNVEIREHSNIKNERQTVDPNWWYPM